MFLKSLYGKSREEKGLSKPMNLRDLSIGLILMLALAGSLLISCGQNAETDPPATGPVVDSVASADGVMIHYEVSGKGEPALVFVHGWSCDRGYWKNQVDEFDETYMVVTVDLGGGCSDAYGGCIQFRHDVPGVGHRSRSGPGSCCWNCRSDFRIRGKHQRSVLDASDLHPHESYSHDGLLRPNGGLIDGISR